MTPMEQDEWASCLAELHRIQALLPNCLTCGGSPEDFFGEAGMYERCPDCTDGKVTVARLVALRRAVYWMNTPSNVDSPRQLLDYLRSVKP